MIARGRLQHHFWGEYCATIVLIFGSEYCALQAHSAVFPMFKVHDTDIRVLIGTFSKAQLRTVESLLRQHGADMDKVSSLRYSIDYSEPFTIDVKLSDGSLQTEMEFQHA